MELIEIIRTSLIIFALISSLFLAISYIVYKFRDRNRVKPYLREENLVSPIILLKGNSTVEKPQAEPQKKNPRFHILNESLSAQKPVMAADALPVHRLRQKPVISYYSLNKNETLHKFSPSRFADEGA